METAPILLGLDVIGIGLTSTAIMVFINFTSTIRDEMRMNELWPPV